MTSRLETIEDSDLGRAWIRALSALCERGVEEISPLVVSVTGAGGAPPMENPVVEEVLDRALLEAGKFPCHTVASTIFPSSLWNPSAPRQRLFDRYRVLVPRLKRVRQNLYGTYFERLIAYGPGLHNQPHNQLEQIIATYRPGRRRSAMQASLFDPLRDQTAQPRRGFPCLQQVAFLPIGNDGLCVTAFYAMQYVFDRAYGNYLGLCRLGTFVSQELHRHLQQVVCIAAVAQLGESVSKEAARTLRDQVRPLVGLNSTDREDQSMEGTAS